MSKKAEGFSLRFVLINTGNISRKVLSKVLRSFDKNFERLQSGMDYKCANELVEYLSVPITEDELRIKIIKLLGKDADEILELMISQELIEKCG